MFPPTSSTGNIQRFISLLLNNREAFDLFRAALSEWRDLERFDMSAAAEASLRDIEMRDTGIRCLGRVEAVDDFLSYINHIRIRSEQ